MAGSGLLNSDEFRLNQLMGDSGGTGGGTGAAGNAAGSWPLLKPKTSSVLVQFTLDVKVVAQVTDRGRAAADGVRQKVTDGTPSPYRHVRTRGDPAAAGGDPHAGADGQAHAPDGRGGTERPDQNHLGLTLTAAPPPANP